MHVTSTAVSRWKGMRQHISLTTTNEHTRWTVNAATVTDSKFILPSSSQRCQSTCEQSVTRLLIRKTPRFQDRPAKAYVDSASVGLKQASAYNPADNGDGRLSKSTAGRFIIQVGWFGVKVTWCCTLVKWTMHVKLSQLATVLSINPAIKPGKPRACNALKS